MTMDKKTLQRLRTLAGTEKAVAIPLDESNRTMHQIKESLNHTRIGETSEEDEKAKRRALDSVEAAPKDKVSLKKAPWESIEESDDASRLSDHKANLKSAQSEYKAATSPAEKAHLKKMIARYKGRIANIENNPIEEDATDYNPAASGYGSDTGEEFNSDEVRRAFDSIASQEEAEDPQLAAGLSMIAHRINQSYPDSVTVADIMGMLNEPDLRGVRADDIEYALQASGFTDFTEGTTVTEDDVDFDSLADQLDQYMYANGLRFNGQYRQLEDENFGMDDIAEEMWENDILSLEQAIADMTMEGEAGTQDGESWDERDGFDDDEDDFDESADVRPTFPNASNTKYSIGDQIIIDGQWHDISAIEDGTYYITDQEGEEYEFEPGSEDRHDPVQEARTETEQMREWANSVYKQFDDRGTIMDQPEGETVDLSLRRYLNAKASPVRIEESTDHTKASLLTEYNKFKKDK